MNDRTFTYKRFMRDGSVSERTGFPRPPRLGKTAKDHRKRTK